MSPSQQLDKSDHEGFTVILPTRDRPQLAFETVAYVRTDLGWTCPMIVVDQTAGHGRQLAALLESSSLRDVAHIPFRTRLGTGAARNEGARRAKTQWFLFLDDDVRPASSYWTALSDFIARNPWVDAVHCATRQKDSWKRYRENRIVPHGLVDAPNGNRSRYPQDWTGVECLTGSPWANYESLTIGTGSGNLAILRRAFFGAGGFDEQIEGLGDDRELGLRLWWYGYRVCFCPDAVAFHLREPAGGIRGTESRARRIFDPEPSPGAVYLYLKWFPGHPYREMIASRLLKAARRPWALPLKVVRLWRSAAAARGRLRKGPLYVSTPMPRTECFPEPATERAGAGLPQ